MSKTVSFLDELIEQSHVIVSAEEPPKEVEADDEIIEDEVDEYLKRLFSLLMLRVDNANKKKKRGLELSQKLHELEHVDGGLLASFRYRHREKTKDEIALHQELETIMSDLMVESEEMEILSSIFWIEVKRRHPILRDKPNIGIRKGWKLCWSRDRHMSFNPEVINVGSAEDLHSIILDEIRKMRSNSH